MRACCVRHASGVPTGLFCHYHAEYLFSFFIHIVFITLKSKFGLSEFSEFNMYQVLERWLQISILSQGTYLRGQMQVKMGRASKH